ncbi:hypothetical protein ACFFSY_22370 [Paenibacillus aurantiacus]|uniref:Uncharacterized protein n=1 Tax=Paenibacillus aurantiacus TaxID=1936118 RepID=A0ABV5KTX6_9BACL
MKEDEFEDFRDQIKKMKRENRNRSYKDQDDVNYRDVIERVKSVMVPAIEAFVDSDRTLEMQSKTFRTIYISYANTRIYGLLVSATSVDNINIDAVFDSNTFRIYAGSFNEKKIKAAVKQALLDWYQIII